MADASNRRNTNVNNRTEATPTMGMSGISPPPSSSTATATATPSPPTLAQVIAIVVALRRLLVVVGLPPVLTVASPLLLHLWFAGVNLFTGGCGVLATAVVILVTALGRSVVLAHAPSWKEGQDALRKIRIILPLLSFVLIRALLLHILLPTAERLGFAGLLQLTPAFHLPTLLRVAASMAVLGLSVVFRLVGPFSVGEYIHIGIPLYIYLCVCICSSLPVDGEIDHLVNLSMFRFLLIPSLVCLPLST